MNLTFDIALPQDEKHRKTAKRALPTETIAESGTSHSKSGTSFNLSNIGKRGINLRWVSLQVAAEVAAGTVLVGTLRVNSR